MKKFKIALMQKKLGAPIIRKDADELREYQPRFICFPEYFFLNKKFETHFQTAHNFRRELKRIEVLSRELQCVVIGGTLPELAAGKIYNASFVYERGTLLGSYRKQNLFFAEQGKITQGDTFKIFTACGIRFGILICADVFEEKSFIAMKNLEADIIFIPTYSPRRKETPEEKFKRDNEIFVNGAKISNAVIVKVCGVKSEFREFLQARSLIADKNGIIYRVNPDEEEKEMIIKKEVSL